MGAGTRPQKARLLPVNLVQDWELVEEREDAY